MFSHHGSAERHCCGKWEQLVGSKMKKDTLLIQSDVLLVHFSQRREGKMVLVPGHFFIKEVLARKGFASVIHLNPYCFLH